METVAKTIPEWVELLAKEARKTNANVTLSFELEDGGSFSIKYHLPRKGGKV